MMEIEYDHADRCNVHDDMSSEYQCRQCQRRGELGEFQFRFGGKGFNKFSYYIICPDCHDAVLHSAPKSSLVYRFRVRR